MPVVVSVVRAVSSGWYPVFDEAMIAVGARDVLTGHHRLIGTVASVSVEGVLANHLGPLQFGLVALPVRLFGSGTGLAVGIAAVNFAAGLVSIIAAARQAGRGAAVATTVGLCLLIWSAGNQVLIDPYNPTASMVPFFAVLILSWATINCDRWALPWLIGWASLCMQANIAYVATTLPIVAGAVVVYLWRRRGQGGGWEVVVRCGPVGLLLWAQPIIEQVVGGTDGNMARLLRNADNLEASLGVAGGTRRAAVVLSMWPGWGRGNFDGYTGFFDKLPSLGSAILALSALLAVLIAFVYASARWLHDPVLATLLATAAAFVVVGWVGTMRIPLSPFFGFLAHFVRWLWPIGAVSVVAVVLFVGRAVQRWLGRRGIATLAVAALIGAASMAIPEGPPALGSDAFNRARPIAVELNHLAVRRLPASGVIVDFPPRYSLFAFSLVAALQEHGTPFAVTDEISLRQFDGRRPPAGSRWPVVFVVAGFEALDLWDGAVACASNLDASQRDTLLRARDAIVAMPSDPGFTLSEDGAGLVAFGLAPPWMAEIHRGLGDDASDLVEAQSFVNALRDGLIVPPRQLTSAARDFVELRGNLEDTTACVLER